MQKEAVYQEHSLLPSSANFLYYSTPRTSLYLRSSDFPAELFCLYDDLMYSASSSVENITGSTLLEVTLKTFYNKEKTLGR